MRKKLDEIAEVTKLAGFEFTKYMKYIDDGEIIAIRALNIKNGRLVLDDVKRIAKDVSEELPRSQLHKYDIVLSYTGTIGESAQIMDEGKFHLAPNVAKVVPNSNVIDPKYLFQYIRGREFKQQMFNYAHGSTQPTIPMATIRELTVPVFDIETERKIANILDAIDSKIEKNIEINDNLEQQAQAIFSTFILDHQTTTVTVEDIVLTANTGADAIQKAPIVDYDTGIRCVRVGDMSNQRPVHEWGFAQVTPEIFKQYQLHKDDIVVTRTASLGLNRLIGEDLSAVYNNGLIRISINQDIVYPLIVYRQFQTNDYRNYISRISGETSVRPNMKINYLLKYSFEIPCLSDQAELISILQPIFETQERNISENQILSSLRDTLLPKLMSGELDVSNLDI